MSDAQNLYADALAWAKAQKITLPNEYYGAISAATRNRSFSIAGLAQLDALQAVHKSLIDALASGKTQREWAKALLADPTAAQMLAMPANRLDNIFRTNLQTSYMRGVARQQESPASKKRRPFYQYDAINDSRTRPAHMAMDNFIAPADDPIWHKWTAPNGYRCRCIRIALTTAEARARGWNGSTKPVPSEPDTGWAHHPLDGEDVVKDLLQAKLANATPALANAVKDMPMVWQEYAKRGADIVDSLPKVTGTVVSAQRFHTQLMERLRKEVGIDGVVANVSGSGAAMVRAASKYFPDTWVAAANAVGTLEAKATTARGARGFAVTLTKDYPYPVKLRSYGVVRGGLNSSYLSTPKNSPKTAIHEYAHILQSKVKGLDAVFQDLHKSRTAGAELKRLRDLEPTKGYKLDEVTREDGYLSPYQGKEYVNDPTVDKSNAALEVLTMGLETVLGANVSNHGKVAEFSAIDLHRMMDKDREMVELVVGLLFHFK